MNHADRSRLPLPGASPRVRFPFVLKQQLPNGLQLRSVEHRSLPVVSFLLMLPVGSAADPEMQGGLSALTSDMLDEGTGQRSAIEVHEALARIGARFDTDVTADATILTLTTLARFAERGLSLLADCVLRPRLEPRDFARVRQLRLTRIVQLRDLPPAVADRAFMHLLYGSHPYGHTPLGSEAALQQITLEDVVGFHRAAYIPAEATLIAVGDIEGSVFKQMAEESFGSWKAQDAQSSSAPIKQVQSPRVPRAVPQRIAVAHRADAAQSELRIGHLGAARDTSDYHALVVLNTILGGQFVSRVNLKLREEKGYTYGAWTSFDFRRGRGPFIFHAAVQTEVTADAIRSATGELQAIREDRPPTQPELELAKAALTRGYARNFETSDQIANALAQLALHGLPDDYFDQFVPRVLEVDVETALRAAQTYLDPEHRLTVIVGNQDAIQPSLLGEGLGEPTVISASI